MDDFGKILNELLKSAPPEAAAPPERAPEARSPDTPDLSGLSPYLRPERREKLSRAQALLGTAYTVRGLLSSLGGILHV